jgi:hypothetical protein
MSVVADMDFKAAPAGVVAAADVVGGEVLTGGVDVVVDEPQADSTSARAKPRQIDTDMSFLFFTLSLLTDILFAPESFYYRYVE